MDIFSGKLLFIRGLTLALMLSYWSEIVLFVNIVTFRKSACLSKSLVIIFFIPFNYQEGFP